MYVCAHVCGCEAVGVTVYVLPGVNVKCCVCSSHSHCYDGWPTVHPFALSILFQCVRQQQKKKEGSMGEKKKGEGEWERDGGRFERGVLNSNEQP